MTSAREHQGDTGPEAATGPDRLADATLDVLIVGGGITGLGTLLECTRRGLRAAVIEQGDLASGTSSRSSNLVHGGLRYLEQLRFRLVRQALTERRLLLRSAPHLVHLESFLVPVWGSVLQVPYYTAGLTLYDVLGAAAGAGRHRWWGADATRTASPSLRQEGLRGALVYADAVMDDARLAVAVARTAIRDGGLVATGVRAVDAVRAGGRLRGVRVVGADGREHEIHAGVTIDATGPWGGRDGHPLRRPGEPPAVRGSRGIHLVLPRARIPGVCGMTIRVPGRVVFLVPRGPDWIVGTTDVADAGDPGAVRATVQDVGYLLDVLARTMTDAPGPGDVAGAYAGLRPLVAGSGSTVTATREHRVESVEPGLVRITGGKYTTFRVMAHDAIDAAAGRRTPLPAEPLDLVGRGSGHDLAATEAALTRDHRLDVSIAASLVARHGMEAPRVAALGRELDLLRSIVPGRPELEVDAAWAVRHELAGSLADVLERRVRLAAALPDRGASIAGRIAGIAGRELRWDASRRDREVEAFLEAARSGHDVPGAPDAMRYTPHSVHDAPIASVLM